MKLTILLLTFLLTPFEVFADPFEGSTFGEEQEASSYDRSLYKLWIDVDGDKEDTRLEVLIEESLVLAETGKNKQGKMKITGGLWVGKYTGFVTTDPTKLDIDHLVPLSEVHRSGGHAWDAEKRKAYANDLTDSRTLIAVYSSANRSKGDKDPASWMPPNRSYWCEYLNDWIAVKKKWRLSIDEEEEAAIRVGIDVCDRYKKRDAIEGLH